MVPVGPSRFLNSAAAVVALEAVTHTVSWPKGSLVDRL